MLRRIENMLFLRLIKWADKRGFKTLFDVSELDKVEFEKILSKLNFTTDNEGWYHKRFVFAQILNDCIEIRTISKKTGKLFRISKDRQVLTEYINYLTKNL